MPVYGSDRHGRHCNQNIESRMKTRWRGNMIIPNGNRSCNLPLSRGGNQVTVDDDLPRFQTNSKQPPNRRQSRDPIKRMISTLPRGVQGTKGDRGRCLCEFQRSERRPRIRTSLRGPNFHLMRPG